MFQKTRQLAAFALMVTTLGGTSWAYVQCDPYKGCINTILGCIYCPPRIPTPGVTMLEQIISNHELVEMDTP